MVVSAAFLDPVYWKKFGRTSGRRLLGPLVTDAEASDDEFVLDLFTLAEWALVGRDGRITVGNGVTRSVQVPALPGVLPPLYLVASIAAPPSWAGHQSQLEVRALDADGQPLATDPLVSGSAVFPPRAVDQPDTWPRLPFVLQITGLPVQRAGTITFVLSLAGEELSSLTLDVRLLQRPVTA